MRISALIRPLTARETLEKFGGQWLHRPGPELRPQRPDIDEPTATERSAGSPAGRSTRGDDQQTRPADTQRRAQERQQQANESDRTEATSEK